MKKIATKVFVLTFSILCVSICVLFANFISSAITVSGNISSTSFSGFTVYAITLGSYTSSSSALLNCETIKKKGGAGYCYEKNGIYYCLASAYEKENDAKLVQENLSSSGTSCSIVEIEIIEPTFPNISSQSQTKIFSTVLLELKNCFLNLYDTAVSLDTKVIDETKAKIEIIEINSSLEKTFENISKGTTTIDGIYYQTIKNTVSNVVKILSQLKDHEEGDEILLSTKIKNAYIEVIIELKSLVGLLSDEF